MTDRFDELEHRINRLERKNRLPRGLLSANLVSVGAGVLCRLVAISTAWSGNSGSRPCRRRRRRTNTHYAWCTNSGPKRKKQSQPSVELTIEETSGKISGVITFFFQRRGADGKSHVEGKPARGH
jgi:hypothetical protein